MEYLERWQGLPYYPISQFYKERFGGKVYKVPVSVAESCPNREGLRGMKTCNFCDVWGSAAYPEFREEDLAEQIETIRARIRKRFNAHQFLVYFQAYTSTFAKTSRLREQFEVASRYDDVLGFVVGTRPDCLSEAVFDLWNEYAARGKFISVELGVQTFSEPQLEWMRRGHTAKRSIQAIYRIKEKCDVNLGLHLMFGLKGETRDQIIDTAKICSSLPIENVKLHNLHILKNTPLAEDYQAGLFEPLSREEYADRVSLFLQYLRPDIAVHRLTAVASRHDELVAPDWAKMKMGNYMFVMDRLRDNRAYQGQLYQPTSNKDLAQTIDQYMGLIGGGQLQSGENIRNAPSN